MKGRLLHHALAPGTQSAYASHWQKFRAFGQQHQLNTFPASSQTVSTYMAYMFSEGASPGSIATHLSAIAYEHKISSHVDPTDSFIVKKLMTGARKLRTGCDYRLPITKDILRKLCLSIEHISISYYEKVLFNCMYLTAFFAFLRIGELAGTGPHVLTIDQVVCNFPSNVTIKFNSFKHHQGRPISLVIKPSSPMCPVQAMQKYLELRGSTPGPLFVYPGQPVLSRTCFVQRLKSSLIWVGFDPASFKSHSFRIGAATEAAQRGLPDSEIQALGRWKSSAFKKYIRFPTVQF